VTNEPGEYRDESVDGEGRGAEMNISNAREGRYRPEAAAGMGLTPAVQGGKLGPEAVGMRVGESGMAKQKLPTLVGVGGHVKGEELPLEYGKSVIVGRSRSADFSMRRMSSYYEMTDEQLEKDTAFRTVSGRHFEITMYNLGSIEIVNLSPNGTRVDGRQVDKIILDDVEKKPHTIEIGAEEKFVLEMKEQAAG